MARSATKPVPTVTGADVQQAATVAAEFLRPQLARSWRAPVPHLGLTVAQVVAHAAGGPLWYAFDLWSGPGDDAAFEVAVKADAANSAILISLVNAARVCAASVDAAPPTTRGFHPQGSPDPSGFAAMACDELLVHTHDAGRGLGLSFRAEAALAARVLTRLFPWHDPGTDPWQTLLWANNRVELPGRPSPTEWRWRCTPLADWDGTPPT